MREFFEAAVENIARHGDTDVFPFPVENHVFHDKTQEVVGVLEDLHANFADWLVRNPPVVEGMLAAAGYTGFRWATQIDPIWNAYFLALVISIGKEIEEARLPLERENVFSYRFNWDPAEKTVFRRDISWVEYQRVSVEKARAARFVLVCDISDFYPRIYHHRLENALQKAAGNTDITKRIMKLLMIFAGNVSYGLPVGGPAARLLSELLLNRVDKLLITNNINFCRYADDYHIFADSAEQAYRALIFLSEKLIANEGLLLQKSKTRVMSREEFLATSEFAAENVPEDTEETEAREFLRLRLHYDPYSATADAEYAALKEELERFDILGMLGKEMRKTRVHQSLTRKLISAVRLLDSPQRDAAALSLLDNVTVLYPVFPSIMLLLKAIIDDMQPAARQAALSRLRQLHREGAYVVQVPAHLAYLVRVLAHDNSDEADEILASIYAQSRSSAIRRDVILAMAKRAADYWVSDIRKTFGTVTAWEKTALVVASFTLGDEGRHWRGSVRAALAPLQAVTCDWAAQRSQSGNRDVPL